MRRSPRVLLAWAAAVVVVLLTVRVVAGDLGSLHRRARRLGTDVAVVVAAHDLPLGTTVGAADVRTVHRPSTTVAADAVHDPAAAVGRVVAVALLRDDVVSARHLAPRHGGFVPDGRRVVHVVAKDGFRPPAGSVVDVLATFDPSGADPSGADPSSADPASVTPAARSGQAVAVAHGAQVVVLAGADPPPDAADSTGSGVTLLVTEAEARSVAYAASIGEVSLALAPVEAACCNN